MDIATDQPPAAAAAHPFSIARVLREGIAVSRRTGLMLAGLTVGLISLPEVLLEQLLAKLEVATAWYTVVSTGLGLTTNLVASMALLHLVMDELAGRRPSIRRSLLQGLRLWPAAFGLALLIGIGTGLGLIFLIVPGLIVIVTCYVAAPYRIAHGPGVMDAIKGSTELSKGSRWAIFGLILVTWSACLLVFGALWWLSMAPIWNAEGVPDWIFPMLISPLYSAFVTIISAVVPAAAFHELTHRGRLGITRAAEVFA